MAATGRGHVRWWRGGDQVSKKVIGNVLGFRPENRGVLRDHQMAGIDPLQPFPISPVQVENTRKRA